MSERTKNIRNVLIVLLLAAIVWGIPGGDTAGTTISNLLSVLLLFLGGLLLLLGRLLLGLGLRLGLGGPGALVARGQEGLCRSVQTVPLGQQPAALGVVEFLHVGLGHAGTSLVAGYNPRG